MNTNRKILKAIKICEEEMKGQNRFSSIPIIVESLTDMLEKLKNQDLNHEKKAKMVGAIGRIVTDDYSFMKSEIGEAVADAINEFMK